MKRAALAFVFLWFLLGGIAHFALTDLEMRIMPSFIPWPRAVVLISGGFELLGAAGLLIQYTRKAAGIGLFALTIAVTPANVYMLEHADLFGIPHWFSCCGSLFRWRSSHSLPGVLGRPLGSRRE